MGGYARASHWRQWRQGWRQSRRVAPMIGKIHWRSVTERHWRLYLGAKIGANPCANLGANGAAGRRLAPRTAKSANRLAPLAPILAPRISWRSSILLPMNVSCIAENM